MILGYDMTARKYAKAFKFLTQRLRDLTHDRKAHLAITCGGLSQPHIIHWCNGTHRYFVNSHEIINPGNTIIDSHMIDSSCSSKFYSVGHLMKRFTKKDFIKMWIDNAINNDLYIYILDSKSIKPAKLLDSSDTVESLCIQYDMTYI